QKVETPVGAVVLATPVRTIGSMKQRRLFATHGPLPVGQPPLSVQPISGAPAQVWSTGPITQRPSPAATPGAGSCRQSGTHAPPGHCPLSSHGCPSFAPPL